MISNAKLNLFEIRFKSLIVNYLLVFPIGNAWSTYDELDGLIHLSPHTFNNCSIYKATFTWRFKFRDTTIKLRFSIKLIFKIC